MCSTQCSYTIDLDLWDGTGLICLRDASIPGVISLTYIKIAGWYVSLSCKQSNWHSLKMMMNWRWGENLVSSKNTDDRSWLHFKWQFAAIHKKHPPSTHDDGCRLAISTNFARESHLQIKIPRRRSAPVYTTEVRLNCKMKRGCRSGYWERVYTVGDKWYKVGVSDE